MKKGLMWIVLLLAGCLMWMNGTADTVTLKKLTADMADTAIDLGDMKVALPELEAFLDQLPALRQVDMFGTVVNAKQIAELTSRYPDIEFGWTIQMAEHTVRTDQTAFSTLHFSGDTPHASKTFEPLKYCTKLQALDLGHNNVSDLSFLYDLPELRILIIACNRVTDLTPVASLKNLEYLEMFSNRVSDLSPLTELPHLMDLNMGYNAVTDYTPLKEMKQLKRLWLFKGSTYTKKKALTDKVVKDLKQALPDTLIDARSQPSLGGWREGEHYETMHTVFYTSQYTPFADSYVPETE